MPYNLEVVSQLVIAWINSSLEQIHDPSFSFDALIFHNRTFLRFASALVQLFVVHVCMVQEENQ